MDEYTPVDVTHWKFKDLTGQRFGFLLALECLGKKNRRTFWLCQCDCGNETCVITTNLLNGTTKSCGCYALKAHITHGQSKSLIYKVYRSMKDRCENPSHKAFDRYGGRGIKVCKRWQNFELFYADMGQRPSEHHSLDRIDNNKGYEPENCRWATREEQMNNRNVSELVTYLGETKSVAQWARCVGINKTTLRTRLQLGWPFEAALSTPVRGKASHAK